ncbi:MAG: VOC family protein [Candidatus Thorarchaeota archaeon]|jgi:predicted enzyme related to lactoylglutathione lyase
MTIEFDALIQNEVVYFELDVTDLDQAKQFYERVFACKVVYDGGKDVGWCSMTLPFPGIQLGLNQLRGEKVNVGSGRLVFSTTDLEAIESYLKQKEVASDPIYDIPDVISILVMYDPDGNKICFASEPRVTRKQT